MFDVGLPIHFLVDAARRAGEGQGQIVMVRQKGDPDRGTVTLLLNGLDGQIQVLTQQRDFDGNLAWINPLRDSDLAESAAEAYVDRLAKRDPDAWILEVEDRLRRNPFDFL